MENTRKAVTVSFRSVTPMIPAGADLAAAIAFYRDAMHFSVTWQSDTGAGIARDDVAFNLVPNTNRQWADNAKLQHRRHGS